MGRKIKFSKDSEKLFLWKKEAQENLYLDSHIGNHAPSTILLITD